MSKQIPVTEYTENTVHTPIAAAELVPTVPPLGFLREGQGRMGRLASEGSKGIGKDTRLPSSASASALRKWKKRKRGALVCNI